MKSTMLFKLLAAFGISAAMSLSAQAHTISIGYVPAAGGGSVNFFAGTYHTPVFNDEETGRLQGVSNGYDSGALPFNIPVVSTKPSGLVDGTNNFYFVPSIPGGSCQSNVTFGGSINTCSEGPAKFWEGLQFTGLSAGDYNFTIANDARTTNIFRDPGAAAVRLTLRAADVSGAVPEPATLALLGLGLMGFAISRQKK